jgi:hypothetical protein
MIPENQAKVGATLKPRDNAQIGVRGRWVGEQWMRGDEANETRPLPSYVVMDARADISIRQWILSLAASNLTDSHRAIFGTFNQNERTGELERFLTPMDARTIRLSISKLFGPSGPPDF